MKGVISKVLVVVGIILILAAILWWAIAVNALVKLPDDVDSTTTYTGEMTWYVDPVTHQPLAEGQELKLPLKVERTIRSLADEYDSSRGVIEEEVIMDLGIQKETQKFVYVLDRKTLENVKDDRAYAWDPAHVVDREGTYYPLLSFDTSKDEKYPVWKNEVGEAVESEFVDEQEKEGITVYNFKGYFEKKAVDPFYVDVLGLPSELTFEDLKPTLAAMGVDVDALLTLAGQRLSAEDQQALAQALEAPIPVNYYWSLDNETSVEPKTGVPVDVYKDQESLSMEPDLTNLASVFAVLMKYKDDPVLGPALAQLSELQAQLGEMEPQKIFEFNYTQDEDSVKEAVDEAKKSGSLITLVKVYIPWILLIVGALVLIVGLLVGGGTAPEAEEE